MTEPANSQGLGPSGFDAGIVIMEAVRDGRVPGAVAAVGRGPEAAASWVAGHADTTPGAERSMRYGTLFDLASLTKVVGTATAVLALAGQGGLGLDDLSGRYLPHFGALREVTVRQLLAHTSGLPDTRKFYEWSAGPDELLRDLYATPLEAPPGTRVTYSDLGFMALGELVATVAGEPLEAAVGHLVSGPLGMSRTSFNPTARDNAAAADDGFAATERGPDGTPWTGVVHDENARLMGGVAGHAGLFAPVADLEAFAAWWAGEDDVAVPARLRREAERLQTAGLDGCRGLGWVRQGDSFDILRGTWPPDAVSHTGFTGTSLAIDPETGTWAVLLTNAVHFGRSPERIRALRREFHAALALLSLAGILPCLWMWVWCRYRDRSHGGTRELGGTAADQEDGRGDEEERCDQEPGALKNIVRIRSGVGVWLIRNPNHGLGKRRPRHQVRWRGRRGATTRSGLTEAQPEWAGKPRTKRDRLLSAASRA